MKKDQPLVSIIIPSYNHSIFIEGAVRSVINQAYKNIELIVIDDGSSDASVEILSGLSDEFGFRFIKQQNIGLSATLNKGLGLVKGKFIGICSSDDEFHKDKVKLQVECLENNLDSGFCYSAAFVFDDNNNVLEKATKHCNFGLSDKVTFEDILTFKIHFPVTGFYRTEYIKKVLGGFDSSLSAEDYDINLRIINTTKVSFVNEKLYYYRTPAAIGSQRKRPVMRRDVSESHLKTLNKYKSHPAYEKALLQWNFRRFIYFSSYRDTKAYAVLGMVNSIKMANSIYFYKAFFRLMFFWK